MCHTALGCGMWHWGCGIQLYGCCIRHGGVEHIMSGKQHKRWGIHHYGWTHSITGGERVLDTGSRSSAAVCCGVSSVHMVSESLQITASRESLQARCHWCRGHNSSCPALTPAHLRYHPTSLHCHRTLTDLKPTITDHIPHFHGYQMRT